MPIEVSLDGFWRLKGFRGCNGEELGAHTKNIKVDDWLLAEAPLTTHTNLLANKLIPDPFKGANEREVQWVSESEWWYRKDVELSEEVVNKDVVEVFFGGLDTFATVWVNDVKVGEASNMFIPWRFNIKEAVKVGRNVVVIRFKPIYKVAMEIEQQHKQKYACLSSDNFSARPYVRKAQYSFGWDWGPTLPTSGIWREAKIVAYDIARIGYFAAVPVEVSEKVAKVKLVAEVYAYKETELKAKFVLSGFEKNLEQCLDVKLTSGRNFTEFIFEVANPKLWWPRGYGEPNLYDAYLEIFSKDELLDRSKIKAGIRRIELIQEPDEEGKSFIFRINGQNVFCKGANWIPADSFLPKVGYEQFQKLLNYAAEANFNMLRVWGGGVYEADEFYDLCDSLGIMIWQDFMYVCAGYPEEEWFLKEAEREAMEAVLRLRNHPSIVVWCGNNENQWLHCVLWRVRDKVERLFGSEIYEKLLLRVCQTLDPTRPYRPSSPFGGEDSAGRTEGDRHNWEVWSKGLDYPEYLKDKGRFLSEFGWQAPPTMKLLRAYLEEKDLNPHSFAFRSHEKQTGGLELLNALLAIHYPVPEDMRLYVYYSQLNQADALKTAVTHFRSRMFKTSGCLIWQLNDCWPVVSWSLIDYGLNPKPAYFAVRRVYKPIIAPLLISDGRVDCYVINETAKEAEFSFKFEVLRFNGESLFAKEMLVEIPAFTSELVFQTLLENLSLTKDCILTSSLMSNGKVVFEDAKTFKEPKELKLPKPDINVKVRKAGIGKFELTLHSKVYVKATHLLLAGEEGCFSDDFFDLLPGNLKLVRCQLDKDCSVVDFENAFRFEAYPYLMGALAPKYSS